MKQRPTLADVAKACGFSLSTVDRVLNARAPVRQATARRVFDAAAAIGYSVAEKAAPQPPETDQRRLGFLLLDPVQEFYQEFSDQLEAAIREAESPPDARFDYIRDRSPEAIAAQIRLLANDRDRLAVACYEHPLILEAIKEAENRDVRVTALLSPLSVVPTRAYIGLDNRRVGRTAAWGLTHLAPHPGKVGIFVGSHRFIGHELREMGFRSYCREHAPAIEVLEPLVNHDDPEQAYKGTRDLLQRYPDLCGIYVAGGGMEGVIQALYDAGAPPLGVVTQELTTTSRQALLDQRISLVIATPLRQLATDLIRQMCLDEAPQNSQQHTLPCMLYTPENC
ncbi:LacI family transcriptional regulator [Marinobacterium nitratireducens]|uniref:LacI family transcriptional regulator n=1 Tax=Marinobacterium nitratireducens TaxID=518897 RepID=A0A917ZIH5_9GAMM|nr:LacI family DNA-binding transcriptional regulator [Marinobacterium nitratireducens]GGO83725.1 LacI family transcriptional regulator [Marinobacterium nitratireducens]